MLACGKLTTAASLIHPPRLGRVSEVPNVKDLGVTPLEHSCATYLKALLAHPWIFCLPLGYSLYGASHHAVSRRHSEFRAPPHDRVSALRTWAHPGCTASACGSHDAIVFPDILDVPADWIFAAPSKPWGLSVAGRLGSPVALSRSLYHRPDTEVRQWSATWDPSRSMFPTSPIDHQRILNSSSLQKYPSNPP